MNFSGKTILVTGASGFVGSHIIAALQNTGARIIGLARKDSSLQRLDQLQASCSLLFVDILDDDAIKAIVAPLKPDYVFNTITCRHIADEQQLFAVNGKAQLNLLQAASSPSLQAFVHCGSSMEYGTLASPLKESVHIQPDTPYGISKAEGTRLLQQYALSNALPLVILRPFYIYGPTASARQFIPVVIDALLQNREISLTTPGYQHDFVYIQDVVEACLLAAASATTRALLPGKIINIASGGGTRNEEIIAHLAKLSGKSALVNSGGFTARPWDRPSWYADITLAKELIDWSPRHDLLTGLQKTLEWHLAQ